jgi:inosine/xanthosine triphosphate pyrophosphatase family protein
MSRDAASDPGKQDHRRLSGPLVIATHNPGKLAELRELLAPYGVEAVAAGELGLAEPAESEKSFASTIIRTAPNPAGKRRRL